jgi:hypothetical protein
MGAREEYEDEGAGEFKVLPLSRLIDNDLNIISNRFRIVDVYA